MKDILQDALKRSAADYTDIRFESEDGTRVAYRGPEVDCVASSRYRGGIVRACVKGGWGHVTFDSVAGLGDRVAEACACAAAVGRETTQLADVAPVQLDVPAEMVHDFRGVSLDDKLQLAARYNDIILKADPAIETSSVHYSDAFRTVWFASSRGACFMEERPRVILYAGAVARADALVQRAGESASSKQDYGCVLDMEEKILEGAMRAAALLRASPCDGGPHTVILDNRLGGVFVHEAFGHLSEADFLYENPKMRDLMVIGREMGVSDLNIIDDGSLGNYLGTHQVDDEGTPTGKTYLVRDGVLAGHLHSLETAAKMGEKPTGNARSMRRAHSPIVRMTNTWIEGGDLSFDDLIKDVDKGIYACHLRGGQTMLEQFTFSAGHGYRIENGQVGELVRDVTLTGNVFETLKRIDGFGNDPMIIEAGGGCGKGGQAPLPVTFGSPHLRIQDVVIGGR